MKTILLDSFQDTAINAVIIIIVGGVLIFTIGRMIALWYYKIDIRLKEQQETNRLLKLLVNKIVHGHTPDENKYEGMTPLEKLNAQRENKEISEEQYLKQFNETFKTS